MYKYAQKKKSIEDSGKQNIPSNVRSGFNAINNVDVHSGRKLDLEAGLKSRIEHSLGFKMDNVELRESHDASAMGANAFAKGNVVHFAPGKFRPDTDEGRHLITHELTHVAQQAGGGVHSNVDGVNVNYSPHLESMADHGISGNSVSAPVSLPAMNAETAPVQGDFGLSSIGRFFRSRFGKKSNDKEKKDAEQGNSNGEVKLSSDADVGEGQAGAVGQDKTQPISQDVKPSFGESVTITGAGNKKASLCVLPNSGPIQADLGEDAGKYKSYGRMLAAIDNLNSLVKTCGQMGDEIPSGRAKQSLEAAYNAAISEMNNYYKEMSGYAFSDSGKAKRKLRREYVAALREKAVHDLNDLNNLGDNGAQFAEVTQLNDDDFTGTIKGGSTNQVYRYKQGYFKPGAKKGESISKNDLGYAEQIGIKYKDENGNAVDARLNQREIATSRLNKLLGMDVIGNSKMAKVSEDTSLKSYSTYDKEKGRDRTFDAVGRTGVLMEAAKGKAYNKINWNSIGIESLDPNVNSMNAVYVLLQSNTPGKVTDRKDTLEKRLKDGKDKFKLSNIERKHNKDDQSKGVNARDPKLQKDMNALFLIDTLSLQTDRHGQNFLIDTDENGNYKGTTGIDNDMSFGTNNKRFGKRDNNYSGLPENMLIDKGYADRIRNMKKPELDMAFGDLLSQEEIDALWGRFQMMSKYIDDMEKKDNLVDKWDDNTAERQFLMSQGSNTGIGGAPGLDYYTRLLFSINMNYQNLKMF